MAKLKNLFFIMKSLLQLCLLLSMFSIGFSQEAIYSSRSDTSENLSLTFSPSSGAADHSISLANSSHTGANYSGINALTKGMSMISKGETPYNTGIVKDGIAIGSAVGLTLLGYSLIENKNDLTLAELAAKSKDDLWAIDRGVAGNYSKQADSDSYILFNGSYALPVVVALIDKKMRSKFGQVMVLYVETVGITGAMYTLTAGMVYRSRPFVYGDNAPLDKRLDKGAQRSFYGGHVATTAAITFFISKVYGDFHPGSKLTPYLYATSTILTGAMGYMRAKAGYHFVTDCILSGIIGAGTGILIPHWHKKKDPAVSISPALMRNGASGLQLTYKF